MIKKTSLIVLAFGLLSFSSAWTRADDAATGADKGYPVYRDKEFKEMKAAKQTPAAPEVKTAAYTASQDREPAGGYPVLPGHGEVHESGVFHGAFGRGIR